VIKFENIRIENVDISSLKQCKYNLSYTKEKKIVIENPRVSGES